MHRIARKLLNRCALAAYGCICTALLLLVGLSVWSSYRELQLFRSALLRAEVAKIRSHAERTVGGLERELEFQNRQDLSGIDTNWLEQRWRSIHHDQRLYAAIVDHHGRIVMHSNPKLVGQDLGHHWYDRLATEAGEQIVETHSTALTSGAAALDIRIPIRKDERELGEFHTGLDLKAFEQWSATEQRGFLRRRLLMIGAVLLLVVLAAISLYYVATHSVFLRRAVSTAHLERAAEISQLAAGLAHEIRNPLHAIRLNLHTFGRAQENGAALAPEEIKTMLDQSSHEIERIDRLMQELVGFATPEDLREELIDLKAELQGVIDFIDQVMIRSEVEVRTEFPRQPVFVRIDPGRLRQILLNLLHNAADASEANGRITVSVTARGAWVELTVADQGHGISDADRERIFQPFFTTKRNGTGLGLALVKRFVEEADGEICCQQNPDGGVSFRIRLADHSTPQRKASK